MKPPRTPAARRVLALWDDAPRGDRFHTAARWWTAPFAALEREIPLSGDILEVGCGHGVFSTYMAICSRSRHVVGVDIDADKIELAQEAAARLEPGEGDVSFRVSPSGEVPRHRRWLGLHRVRRRALPAHRASAATPCSPSAPRPWRRAACWWSRRSTPSRR